MDIALGTASSAPSRVFAEAIVTRFQISILPDEWRYCFAHVGRVSRVRVAEMPEPDGRDDYSLASSTPALNSTLLGAEPIVRAWSTTL